MVLFLSSLNSLQAQTFREWFKQKKTQKEYLVQQIAALWAYGSQLREGYNLVRDSTGIIGASASGELGLHKDFFDRLKAVDPKLVNSGKVESVLRLHSAMEKQRTYTWRALNGSDLLNNVEKQQARILLDGLAKSSGNELHDMQITLSSGMLELTDDERIKRIDKIYRSTQEIYKVHSNTLPRLISLLQERQQYNRELELLRRMHGLGR